MYSISRWLLKLATIVAIYSLFFGALISWPVSGVFMIAVAAAAVARWRTQRLTTLGSARWADEKDLDIAEMLRSESGLILGRIRTQARRMDAICALFSGRVSSQAACEQFWNLFKRGSGRLVRASQAIHTAVFAPSGVGKGVSCIIPFLRDCAESVVSVDFKGENAKLTAEHRRTEFGHQVALLDPFSVVTESPDCFNPLDAIDASSPLAIDECNDLAKALVVRTSEEKEPHWNDSAELWISAMIATVVRYGQPGVRSLQTVRDLFSNPERIDIAIKLMLESDAWEGMLARMGGQLSHFIERERSSTLSTVSRHLRFLDTPAIAASTRASSFNPALLLSGKMSIYLILPPEHMRAQSALMRMWIGSLLRAVVRGGLRTKDNVHFVLDEAASLGNLETIEDAVDKFRGYGVRLQFYYQSLGQLKKCFPNGQDHTLLSNTTQVFFGVNDTATAELVSSRLGDQTVIVESGGTSNGASWQNSMSAQNGTSHSYNTNSNWQQQARKLLKPEEVIALSPRTAITFTPGVPPICTTLLRYYEESHMWARPRQIAYHINASRVLTASALLCMLSLGTAALVVMAMCKSAGM